MDAVVRYVNLSFMMIGVITYVVMAELYASVIGMIGGVAANQPLLGVGFRLSDLLGLVTAIALTIVLKRNERVSTYALEVGNELSKVTWPTWKETKMATFIVIIITIIISLILGVFDWVWAALSSIVYDVK
jgi:preprotein translocase subunit SecE